MRKRKQNKKTITEKVISFIKEFPPEVGQYGYYDIVAKKTGAKNGECVRSIIKSNKLNINNIRCNIQSKRTFNMDKPVFEQVELNEKLGVTITIGDCIPKAKKEFFDIPESKSEDYYHLSITSNKTLVLSDIHFPYHNVEALRLALEYGYKEEVDTIILNGDICDFYQLSRFDKIPSKTKMSEEIEMCRGFLSNLRKAFPNCKIYYKEGNHEERLMKYIINSAAALFGLEEITLPHLLKFNDSNIIHVPSKQIMKWNNKLNVLHGHEIFAMPLGVNPARTLRMKADASILCGHFHRSTQELVKDIDNNIKGAWTTGCLCELNPEYMRVNNWNHGFAVIKNESGNNYTVENKLIMNNKIY